MRTAVGDGVPKVPVLPASSASMAAKLHRPSASASSSRPRGRSARRPARRAAWATPSATAARRSPSTLGMVRVGGDALQPVKQQRAQADHVRPHRLDAGAHAERCGLGEQARRAWRRARRRRPRRQSRRASGGPAGRRRRPRAGGRACAPPRRSARRKRSRSKLTLVSVVKIANSRKLSAAASVLAERGEARAVLADALRADGSAGPASRKHPLPCRTRRPGSSSPSTVSSARTGNKTWFDSPFAVMRQRRRRSSRPTASLFTREAALTFVKRGETRRGPQRVRGPRSSGRARGAARATPAM